MPISGRDEEFTRTISALYREELGRDPDPGGLASWLQNARNGMTGAQIRAGLHDSAEGVLYRSRPPEPPKPSIAVPGIAGDDFIDAGGKRTVLLIVDGFRVFERMLKGEDLSACYRQWRDLGFTWIRVFFSYCVDDRGNGIGRLVPREFKGFYDQIPDAAREINAAGFGVYATALADAQRCFRSVAEQQEHCALVGAGLKGTVATFSVGNEHGDWTHGDFGKNGFNPGDFSRIPGLLCSRGAGVQDVTPFRPTMDFAEFRNRRDMPAMLFDAVASPWTIRERDGVACPLVFDECTKFGAGVETDPRLARQLASHYAIESAGLCFHSNEGIDARPMDEVTARCAAAWVDGARRQF